MNIITLKGDIFNYYGYGVYIGCTTNGNLNKEGKLIMGAGIAKEFAQKFTDLPETLGFKVKKFGNNVYLDQEHKTFSFPTKESWKEPSNLETIDRSLKQLIEIARAMFPTVFILPYPGIGCGKLTKEQIEPVLKQIEQVQNIYLIERG